MGSKYTNEFKTRRTGFQALISSVSLRISGYKRIRTCIGILVDSMQVLIELSVSQ